MEESSPLVQERWRMFQKLDPRVRLLWWLAISLLAMAFNSVTATIVLLFALCLSWQTAGLLKKLTRFTIGLTPFLVVITAISLFPTFELDRGIRMALRYYVLLGATTLVMATTSYADLTNALRNLRHASKSLEVFSLIFGLAFLTVPLTAEEWIRMKEVQRIRGVDLARGSRIAQVRRGLVMLQPLLLRILERIKLFSVAVIVYGYNPFESRTLYQPLIMSRWDKRVAFALTASISVGVILAFAFRV